MRPDIRRQLAAVAATAAAAAGAWALAGSTSPVGAQERTPEEECTAQGGSWDGDRCIFFLDESTTTVVDQTTVTEPVPVTTAPPAPSARARAAEAPVSFTG